MPEGKSAENRVHIDIRVAGEGRWDMPGRGATDPSQGARTRCTRRHRFVREEYNEDILDHIVILDPEGNEFCVA